MSGPVVIRGLPDLREALRSLPDKLRRRAARNALAAGARVVRDAARAQAPVLREPLKAPFRKPGTLRQAISVRTSKLARRSGDVGVFVNVRPLKRGAVSAFKSATGLRAAKNPRDPFYWRFLEFGTRFMTARPFLAPAAQRLSDALRVITARLGPAIDKLNRPKAPAP